MKTTSECFWCDEQWGLSSVEVGMHDIEADGIYSTAPCLKLENAALRRAQAIVDRSGEENFQQRALWREAIQNEIIDAVRQARAMDIIAFLNDLLERDRPAVAALIANRVPCNQELAAHPSVQVAAQHGGYHVGLLGILNGLCGVREDGNGYIEAVFDTVKPDSFDTLVRFRTH